MASQPSSYATGVGEAGLKSSSQGRAPSWSRNTQSAGTFVRQSSIHCAIRRRTNGAYGETITPVWSPYATVEGARLWSSTATSLVWTPAGSVRIVGEVGSHQLRFPYGITRS